MWSFLGDIVTSVAFVVPVALFIYHVFAIGFVIFNEKDDSAKAIAWVFVVAFIPFIGFIAYMLLGYNWRARRAYRKRIVDRAPETAAEARLRVDAAQAASLDERQRLLLHMIGASQPLPASGDNLAQVFFDGPAKFAALRRDIEEARQHIHLEYFIWQRDELGNELRELLFRKIAEGVEVRLLLDAAGCKTTSRRYLRQLRERGLAAYFFHPTTRADLMFINHRDHRKAAVIDGRIGYTGGFNVGNEYINKGRLGFWRDTHVRLEGGAVHDLQSVFLSDWAYATREELHGERYFPASTHPGDLIVQISPSGLDVERPAILYTYFQMITSAERTVRLWTPYFMPEPGLLTALQTAALSGVDVKIITPGRFDHPPVQWAGRTFMPELMEIGIEFYEYQDGFVHSKTMSIDDDFAAIGTANFDHRSMRMDFELTAAFVGKTVAGELNAQFEKDLAHSRKVERTDFIGRPLLTNLKESLSRLASPLY